MAKPAEHGTVNQDARKEGEEARRLDRLRAIEHNRRILNHNQGAEKMKYRLICMSFDGEYVRERPVFNNVDEAFEYSNDLGSKWFFYPFHFVTTESYKTIRAAGYFLEHLEGMRTKTIEKIFSNHSKDPEMGGADIDKFAITI